jgi:hypothetical protein
MSDRSNATFAHSAINRGVSRAIASGFHQLAKHFTRLQRI